MKTLFLQRSGLFAVVLALLVVAGVCGRQIHTLSERQKAIKRDYSIINNVSYGLLSVSRWRDLLVRSVGHQIENFSLTRPEQDSLRKEIQSLLDALIDKADSIMSRPQKSIGGKLRKLAFKAFVKPSNLHKETPAFADKIMHEVMQARAAAESTDVDALLPEQWLAEFYAQRKGSGKGPGQPSSRAPRAAAR